LKEDKKINNDKNKEIKINKDKKTDKEEINLNKLYN